MHLMRKYIHLFALLASLAALAASGYAFFVTNSKLSLTLVLASGLGFLAAAILVAEVRASRTRLGDVSTALNNISQGLCMFDGAGRLVLYNERYIEMYKLSTDIVKPGCSLRDLLIHRKAVGMFSGDVEEYIKNNRADQEGGRKAAATVELSDGRIVTTLSRPLHGGGWVATHEDVTALHRREQELARTRAFLNSVIDNVPAAISVKDATDLRYALINRAGEEIYGLSRDRIIGKTVHELFPDRAMDRIEQRDRAALDTKTIHTNPDQIYISPTRGERIHSARRVPVLDEQGNPLYLLLVIQDITDQRAAEARIAYLYRHDPLTELPNRAAFNEHLNGEIDKRQGTDRMLAVLCANFDHFKDINDVYGNAVGDELLKSVAKRLSGAAEGAYVARLGGDEFAFVIADDRLPASAAALGDRVLAAMADEFSIQGHNLRIGLSIGVATYPNDGADIETLLANANAALYRVKSGGRGSMRFFEARMDDQLRERRALAQDLRAALDRRELLLHYQPQAKITGEIVGFEALVRWNHPTQGQIPPAIFVPLAEENGLIMEMGEWILREACREAASWNKPLRIAVNLSAAQFRHGDLVGLVHSVLLETGLAATRLEIEITESMLADDFSRAASILRRIKTLGVHIAMDDFGTGYSSLKNLQSLSFDKLKIDRSFIHNVETSQHSATIVRAVIGLSRGLGLPTVAEGVETQAQLDFLIAESCDEVQGFLIGRPLPIAAYADVVAGAKPFGKPRIKKAVA